MRAGLGIFGRREQLKTRWHETLLANARKFFLSACQIWPNTQRYCVWEKCYFTTTFWYRIPQSGIAMQLHLLWICEKMIVKIMRPSDDSVPCMANTQASRFERQTRYFWTVAYGKFQIVMRSQCAQVKVEFEKKTTISKSPCIDALSTSTSESTYQLNKCSP